MVGGRGEVRERDARNAKNYSRSTGVVRGGDHEAVTRVSIFDKWVRTVGHVPRAGVWLYITLGHIPVHWTLRMVGARPSGYTAVAEAPASLFRAL